MKQRRKCEHVMTYGTKMCVVCVLEKCFFFCPCTLVFVVTSFWPFIRAVRTCTWSPSPRDCRPAHATSSVAQPTRLPPTYSVAHPRDCRSPTYSVAQPTRLSPSPRDILHASPHYFPAVCYGVFYPRGPAPRGRRVQTIPRVSHTRIAHAKVHRAPCSPLSTFSAGLYMAPKPPSPNPRFLRFHQLLYVRIFHR